MVIRQMFHGPACHWVSLNLIYDIIVKCLMFLHREFFWVHLSFLLTYSYSPLFSDFKCELFFVNFHMMWTYCMDIFFSCFSYLVMFKPYFSRNICFLFCCCTKKTEGTFICPFLQGNSGDHTWPQWAQVRDELVKNGHAVCEALLLLANHRFMS